MKAIAALLAASLAAIPLAYAADDAPRLDKKGLKGRFGVNAGAGSDGAGVDLSFAINPYWVARIGGRYFDIDRSFSIDGVRYDAAIRASTLFAGLDAHPFKNGFFLGGGVYLGRRGARGTATPAAGVEIGGQSFTPAELGVVNGELSLGRVAGFGGFGFDNLHRQRGGHWGFRLVAGAAFTRRPGVALSSTGGTLSADPILLTQIAQEEQNIANDAAFLRFAPVVNLSLGRRF